MLVVALVAVLLTAGAAPAIAAPASEEPRPTFGRDVSQRVGLGMLSPEVPAGLRYLFSRRSGFEVGLGFRTWSDESGDATEASLDGGYLHALAPGTRINVYLRPGARFINLSRDPGSTTTIQLNLSLSFEVFITRDFSVTATQGLAVDFASPPDRDGEPVADLTSFRLLGESWPRLGFFYYFSNE